MKKEEYIEKYGQEAWDRKAETTRIWRKNHPDKKYYKYKRRSKDDIILKYGEEWYKEHVLEKGKARYRQNMEKYIKSASRWREENKEKSNEIKNNWRKNNPQKVRARSILDRYTDKDNNDNRGECTITVKWIMDNIFTSKCIYCGDSDWRHLGCDRIDNSKPHTEDNVVCSCGICNIERGDRYSVEEFIEYRKTHPRDTKFELPQQIVEVNGKRVIRKVL